MKIYIKRITVLFNIQLQNILQFFVSEYHNIFFSIRKDDIVY